MRIQDIKDRETRELAIQRRYEQGRGYKELLCDAFIWDATPERAEFWLKVNREGAKKETNEDILLDTIEQYKNIVKTLERRIEKLTEFNNSLINML